MNKFSMLKRLKLKKLGLIDDLLKQRKLDINERNKILDNPFKIYIPYYRKKLRLIDKHLDELELKIYSIQSESLRKIQFSAEKKLKNITDLLLNKKNIDFQIVIETMKLTKYSINFFY